MNSELAKNLKFSQVDGSDKTRVVEEVALSRNSRYADFFFTHAFTDMAKRSINHLTYRFARLIHQPFVFIFFLAMHPMAMSLFYLKVIMMVITTC